MANNYGDTNFMWHFDSLQNLIWGPEQTVFLKYGVYDGCYIVPIPIKALIPYTKQLGHFASFLTAHHAIFGVVMLCGDSSMVKH